MKKNFVAAVLFLSAVLLFSSCDSAQSTLYTPTPAPLPVLSNIDWNDIPEAWPGTGGKEPSEYMAQNIFEGVSMNSPYEYYSGTAYSDENYYYSDANSDKHIPTYWGVCYFNQLPNTELQDELNGKIAEICENFYNDNSFFYKYLPEGLDDTGNTDAFRSLYADTYFSGNLIFVHISCYNSIWSNDESALGINKSQDDHAVLAYDMLTCQPVTLSDIFVDGTDLNELLNPLIVESLNNLSDEGLIRPFRGLPRDYSNFVISNDALEIHLPSPNPYSDFPYVSIPLDKIADKMAQPYAPLSEALGEENVTLYYRDTNDWSRVRDPDNEAVNAFGMEDYFIEPYYVKNDNNPEAAEKINRQIKAIYDSLPNMTLPDDWPSGEIDSENAYRYAYCDISLFRPFIMFNFNAYYGEYGMSSETGDTVRIIRCFDTETGDLIPLDALISDKEGFRAYLEDIGFDGYDEAFANFGSWAPDRVFFYPEYPFVDEYDYTLPAEYIDLEYFK